MPTMTEQEILDRFTSRLSAAKQLAAETGVSIADAQAQLGAPVAPWALSSYVPPEPVTTSWEMTAGGIVEKAPAYITPESERIYSTNIQEQERARQAAEDAAMLARVAEFQAANAPTAGAPPGGNGMNGTQLQPINGGGVKPGDPLVTAGLPAGALGAIPGILGALGITMPAWLGPVLAGLGGAAAAYGVSQAAGVQYPWETATGQGFIAPWTSQTVDPLTGKYIATEGRQALGGAMGLAGGAAVVKTWTASGWPFAMTSDGRIHTITKNGIRKSWKPAKPIVMVRGKTTLGQAVRAQRYLDRMWRTVARRTKALKLA